MPLRCKEAGATLHFSNTSVKYPAILFRPKRRMLLSMKARYVYTINTLPVGEFAYS